jgi:hypothetical protein
MTNVIPELRFQHTLLALIQWISDTEFVEMHLNEMPVKFTLDPVGNTLQYMC